MKSFVSLASRIAKKEGKLVSISVGNIREVLKILVELELEALNDMTFDETPSNLLINSAVNNLKKTKPKKGKK
jgi:hypothetical protein